MNSIKIENIPTSYNSKLIKISSERKNYIIKLFPKQNNLNFVREVYFLTNFKSLKYIPKIISCDYINKILVLSYLNGAKVQKNQAKYLPQIFDFLKKIQAKKFRYIDKNKIIRSKEGCFSLIDHLNYSKKKIIHIKKNKKLLKNSNFSNFINKLNNIYDLKEKNILNKYKMSRLRKKFNMKNLILSPSDFGFNNILIKSKKLFFLDFEYSGLDDPCQLCFDFMANPNTKFNNYEYKFFIHKFSEIFKIKNFENIYNDFIDFYYIKWSILIFNFNFKKNKTSKKDINTTINKTLKYLKKKKIWK